MPPVIDETKCSGCGVCHKYCPGDLFGFNRKKRKPRLLYPEECWHCGVCRMDCPEEAIRIVFPMEMI